MTIYSQHQVDPNEHIQHKRCIVFQNNHFRCSSVLYECQMPKILGMGNNRWRSGELLKSSSRTSAYLLIVLFLLSGYLPFLKLAVVSLKKCPQCQVPSSLQLMSASTQESQCCVFFGSGWWDCLLTSQRSVDDIINSPGPAVHHPGHLKYVLTSSDATTGHREWPAFGTKLSLGDTQI